MSNSLRERDAPVDDEPALRPRGVPGTDRFDTVDAAVTGFMARRGVDLLRWSLGLVYLWFGGLKLFPGLSPAEALAGNTIEVLTLGLLDPRAGVVVLALWEILIGLGLLSGRFLRVTLGLLFVQMPGTIMPLLIFPDVTFVRVPFVLTIEGQYIVKNMVLVASGLVIGATVRGGRMTAEEGEEVIPSLHD